MITDATVLDSTIDRRLAVDLDASEKDCLEAYLDSLGNWTIGRGHLMPPHAPGKTWAGFTIIQSTSDRYFNGDILNAIELAKKWAEYASCDTDCRKNALYELAFNMGGKWEKWGPTRALMVAQDWQGVHDHLLGSLWAHEVGTGTYSDGKPKRATRVAQYFLTGAYPCQSGT